MIGSIVGGIMGKMGGDAAAESADRAGERAAALTREGTELARRDISPFRYAGRAAIDQAIQALGLGRLYTREDGFDDVTHANWQADQAGALSKFKTDPGYEFRRSEGEKAINRSMAARGGVLSGAAVKAGQRFADNLAEQEFKNYFDRLLNVATGGTSAAGASGSAAVSGANAGASAITQSGIAAGQARKSGYESLGSGIASGFNNTLAAALYGKNKGWI